MAGKTRRGNGEGSIRELDGRWEARFTLPGGTRRSFYDQTREEARRKLATAVRKSNDALGAAILC